jgi:ABC-type Fe3+ transport system substrate-binding protein
LPAQQQSHQPNTARLFIDFALSKRSQQMIRDLRLVPPRRDVEPLVAKMDQNRLKVKRIPKEVSLNTDQYAKESRNLWFIIIKHREAR